MSAEFNNHIDSTEERKLLSDVASIQERSEFHDVSFICKDGIIVRANRAYIACRCEFFHRLLFGAMRESKMSEIDFHSTSSTSLEIVLEYLHTCGVRKLNADSMAVEAYDLARQYHLPGLQHLIVHFLVRHARQNASIGDIISTALELRALDVAETLLPVVSSALEERNSTLFNGFSVTALEFCLQHPKLRAGSPYEIDIFRSILHWAVSCYLPSFMVHAESNNNLITDEPWGLTIEEIASLREVLKNPQNPEFEEWKKVLCGIQFEKIPTHLLEEKIENLELVPVEILLRAYCSQASRFSKVALRSSLWDPNCRGRDVRIEQDLCDFQSKYHQGARSQTPFVCGVHTWDIIIEKYCDLVWIGVVSEDADMNEWLGKQTCGWMFGSNGTLCHDTKQDNGPYSHKYGVGFRDDAILTAKLDMNKRELGFSINGVNYGVAFKNLPSKVYPAVSCRNPGLIKISFGEKLWALLDSNP